MVRQKALAKKRAKTCKRISLSLFRVTLCLSATMWQIKLEDNGTFDRLTLVKATFHRKQDFSFPAVGYDAFQSSQ